MILIYFIVALVQCSVFEANHYSRIDSINSCSYTNCSFTPNGHFRFVRQAKDPLDTTIDRMQTIARLTNAIYLQQGLLDESVLPYDVIAELLFFGDVKQDALNDPGIGKVFEEVEALPDKLLKSIDLKAAQTAYEILFTIKDHINGVTDYASWSLKEKFKTDLTNLQTKGLNLKALKSLDDAVQALKTYATRIEQHSTDKDEKKSKRSFEDLLASANRILPKANDLPKSIDTMVQMTSGNSAAKSFSDVAKLSDAVKVCENNLSNLRVNVNGKDEMVRNIELISGASKKATMVMPYLDIVKSIVQSRKKPNRGRTLKHTPGFPNGYDDLDELTTTVSDSWLRDISGIEKLPTAFLPLELFSATVEKVSDGLGPLKSQITIDVIHNFMNGLATSGSISSNGSTKLFDCASAAPFSNLVKVVDLSTVHNDVKRIDEELIKMKRELNNIADFFKDANVLSILENVKRIASKATSDDKTLLVNTVKEFMEYKEASGLDEMITSFDTVLTNAGIKPLRELAITVLAHYNTIDNFLNELTVYNPLFECLNKVNYTEVNLVNKKILKSKQLQSPIAVQLKTEMKEVTNFVDSLQKVKTSADVIENMKNIANVESKALAALDTPDKHSETLGQATRGITNMRDVMLQERNLKTVRIYLKFIGAVSKNLSGIPKEESKRLENYYKFKEIEKSLEEWKHSLIETGRNRLENEIFENGRFVEGIEDVKKMSETVAKIAEMEKNTKDKKHMEDVNKALDELDAIGLDFSEYQKYFEKTEESLKAVELFFVKINETLNPTRRPKVITTTNVSIETTTLSRAQKLATVLIGSSIIVALIAGAVLCFCWASRFCCFKEQRKDELGV